ncbi:MAG: adenylosuccinate lyase family protein [Acidobacteriota bacterium]
MFRLIDCLATTGDVSAAFSDRALLRAMLDFEVALARVQARLGVIPSAAADVIASAMSPDDFDVVALASEARESATLSIPFVKALTARVRAIHSPSATCVHWGATSQDLFDTALVLCLQRARPTLQIHHGRLLRALLVLSDRHAESVMLGRTLLQAAPPITFGLKVAGWASSVHHTGVALHRAFDQALVLQFGGATGTLAALGADAEATERALATELGLASALGPWHTRRDRLTALVSQLGLYTVSLGKMAHDVALLMQTEVGEVSERGGGSSTMPHKRNPSSSAIVLAAVARLPGLVSSFMTGAVQAHERGVGGWHAEAPTIAAAVEATGSALAAAVDAVEGLTVDPERMRANIAATKGVVFAERLMFLLAPKSGRESATALVTEAIATCQAGERTLSQVAAAMPEIAAQISTADLELLEDPRTYLGLAEPFRRRLLGPIVDLLS